MNGASLGVPFPIHPFQVPLGTSSASSPSPGLCSCGPFSGSRCGRSSSKQASPPTFLSTCSRPRPSLSNLVLLLSLLVSLLSSLLSLLTSFSSFLFLFLSFPSPPKLSDLHLLFLPLFLSAFPLSLPPLSSLSLPLLFPTPFLRKGLCQGQLLRTTSLAQTFPPEPC